MTDEQAVRLALQVAEETDSYCYFCKSPNPEFLTIFKPAPSERPEFGMRDDEILALLVCEGCHNVEQSILLEAIALIRVPVTMRN